MIQRKILCEQDYLHIPIIPGGKWNEMQIWADGDLALSPRLALTDEGGEYFFLNVRRFKGRELLFMVPQPNGITGKSLERIVCGEAATVHNPLYSQLYREPRRPAFHFSSKRGWLNDPNGLVYKDGIYHMFYQHNPLGTPHGNVNVCWGHAVSRDLLHWEEKDDAIYPWRRDWLVASGSAVVDYENRAGYGKDAIIAAFTALACRNVDPDKPDYPSGGQFFAASTDDGNTFYRFSHEATIPARDGKGWRDPRLFRYEDHYVAAVYETDEKNENCVSFYVSEDFHTWKRTSCNDNLYECPDIFPLQVEGEEETRWVLYGADGMARIGDFDGYRFMESGEFNPLDYGDATYAGQSWSHHPEGKRVHISWIRNVESAGSDLECQRIYQDMPFSQCMSIPAQITLKRFGDRLHVCRRPVDQVDRLIGEILSQEEFSQTDTMQSGGILLPIHSPAHYRVTLTDVKSPVTIRAGERVICYDPADSVLSFENGHRVTLSEQELHFDVLVDTTSMEFVFADCIMATYSMGVEAMGLKVEGGCRLKYVCRAMKNIWTDVGKGYTPK